MPLATLIVNSVARQARLFEAQLPAIHQLLVDHDYVVTVSRTTSVPGSASGLASAAVSGSSLILACGGDGTVHEVLQGMAQSAATLGIIPLGTANALARNLSIPMDPLAAVRRLLGYQPKRIPLGQVSTGAGMRWFLVMAGCGPDGMLVDELSQAGGKRLKVRFGRAAYYIHAARLLVSRRWPEFNVTFRESSSRTRKTLQAVAVMASRVADLGGVFSGTTPLARMTDTRLHVKIIHRPAWLSLPAWMLFARIGLHNPWLTTVDVAEVECAGAGVYAQADAEPIGQLPMRLSVVPAALSLLMPPDAG